MKFRAIAAWDGCFDEEEMVPPVSGAVREYYLRRDERDAGAPDEVPAFRGQSEWWFKEGQNHRCEDGHIVRDMPDEDWFVDVPDLPALMALLNGCNGVFEQWPSGREFTIRAHKRPEGKLVWVPAGGRDA